MLNVVLLEPEIPSNAGNVGRTCALAGACLHLVKPYGFDLTDRALKRAGMAYWSGLGVVEHASWEAFLQEALGLGSIEEAGRAPGSPGVHLLTKRGARLYTQASYRDGDFLVFGKESTGIGRPVLDARPDLCERVPMLPDADAVEDASAWHARHERLVHDACGNFVQPDAEASGDKPRIGSLNLSNAVAVALFEALRQLGFPGML